MKRAPYVIVTRPVAPSVAARLPISAVQVGHAKIAGDRSPLPQDLLGSKPILDIVAVRAAALEKQGVGHLGDLILTGSDDGTRRRDLDPVWLICRCHAIDGGTGTGSCHQRHDAPRDAKSPSFCRNGLPNGCGRAFL